MATKLRGPKEAEAKYECAQELLISYNKLNCLLPSLSVHLKLVLLMSIFPAQNLFSNRVVEGMQNGGGQIYFLFLQNIELLVFLHRNEPYFVKDKVSEGH